MSSLYIPKKLAFANGATATESFSLDTKDGFAVGLLLGGIRLDTTITANTFYVEISDDNSTWDRRYDGVTTSVAKGIAVATKGMYDNAPGDYCVFPRYVRLAAASVVSAACNVTLYLRDA